MTTENGSKDRMSLEKAIKHGREHRKPYYDSRRFDWSCRGKAGCAWCEGNRLFNTRKREFDANEQMILTNTGIGTITPIKQS